MDSTKLLDKLQKLEALQAGTDFSGERDAALAAIEKLRERLKNSESADPPVPYKFSMGDMWSRKLFVALLRRYGISPYRRRGKRHTTVMADLPKRFVDDVLWPQFEELSNTLDEYLAEVTDNLISESVFEDVSEAEMRPVPDRLTV